MTAPTGAKPPESKSSADLPILEDDPDAYRRKKGVDIPCAPTLADLARR